MHAFTGIEVDGTCTQRRHRSGDLLCNMSALAHSDKDDFALASHYLREHLIKGLIKLVPDKSQSRYLFIEHFDSHLNASVHNCRP